MLMQVIRGLVCGGACQPTISSGSFERSRLVATLDWLFQRSDDQRRAKRSCTSRKEQGGMEIYVHPT